MVGPGCIELYFDGKYTEMSKFLNYKIEPSANIHTSEIDDKVFFLHYTEILNLGH